MTIYEEEDKTELAQLQLIATLLPSTQYPSPTNNRHVQRVSKQVEGGNVTKRVKLNNWQCWECFLGNLLKTTSRQ